MSAQQETAPSNPAPQSAAAQSPAPDPGYNWKAPTPKLTAAFAKARAEYPPIPKNRTSRVVKDGKLLYEFHYADLADILTATAGPLSKNGLTVSDEIEPIGQRLWLFTYLRHESGEMRRSMVPLPDNQAPQQWGGFLTYMRRYQTGAILGVASEEDDDGNRAAGNEHTTGQRERKPAQGKGDQKAKGSAGPSPAEASGASKTPPAGSDPATTQDIKGLFATAKGKGWTEQQLKDAMGQLFNKESTKTLSRNEISDLRTLCGKYGPEEFVQAFVADGQIVKGPDGRWTG